MNSLSLILIPRLAWAYLRLVEATSRIVWKGTSYRDEELKRRGNLIFAFWHGRQFFLPRAYRGWDGVHILVSRSRDGELISRVIEHFGMKTVRGSSSRGGVEALLSLKSKLEEGKSIGITPDGPRGPQRSVHEGVLYLAKETGRSILPVNLSCKRKIIFRGWDDYWVPLPFNRIVISHGPVLQVSGSIEEGKIKLQDALNRLTDGEDRSVALAGGSWTESLTYFIYNFILIVFSPLILAAVLVKYPKNFIRDFRAGIGMRFGRYPAQNLKSRPVWVHAASLGECRAALPLATALRKARPEVPIVFSTTTRAGYEEARRLHLGDEILFSPLDFSFAVGSALRKFDPRLALFLESEIWPNWLKAAQERGTAVGVVNGRLSERSARRYAFFRGFCRAWIGKIDFVCAREAGDARRYKEIGVPEERITLSGNLKFDLFPWNMNGSAKSGVQASDPDVPPGPGPLWTAGSIREGEIPLVLEAFAQAHKKITGLRLILAPRHLNHVPEIESAAAALGFRTVRRSQMTDSVWDVLVWDTFGDLWKAYRACDLSFVGGSLVPLGGQNPIEPAYFEKPVLFGPHMENFEEPAKILLQGGGAVQVRDSLDLCDSVVEILSDPARKLEIGRAAKKSIDQFAGKATEATLQVVLRHLDAS